MKPYNVATSCEAVSARDKIRLVKEIVFPFKPDLRPATAEYESVFTVSLNIPAHVLEEIEDRRDAIEADRILHEASPGDFVPWDEAKRRLEL